MSYKQFMEKMNDNNRTKNYYFAEQRVPLNLENDIIEPIYGKYMNPYSVLYWDGIGTKSLGH